MRRANVCTVSCSPCCSNWWRHPTTHIGVSRDWRGPSTVYRLMVPLVLLRLCQRHLTVVDLSLEPEIHHQYTLAKLLYRSWNAVRSLTELGSHPIAYEPYRGKSKVLAPTNPAIEARQHLNLQQIDQAVESLIIEEGPTRLLRCRTDGGL